MKTYVISVAGMAVLTTLFSLLAGEKKQAKLINGILKVCMIATLVTPVISFFQQDSLNFSFEPSILGQDVAYINNSYDLAIEKELENAFRVTAEVQTEVLQETPTKDVAVSSVKIYILDFGMNEEGEHINIITQIVARIKTLCGCEDVEVYDNA